MPLRAKFTYGDGDQRVLSAFGQFRKEFFIDQLGWKLSERGSVEADEFDRSDTLYCVLMVDEIVVGGFRAIACDQPYLTKEIFHHLATDRDCPSTKNYWEVSRFGVGLQHSSVLAPINYALMLDLARAHQVLALVAIVEVSHERHLARLGVKTTRYGAPKVIGYTRIGTAIEAVAGEIPLLDQSGPRYERLLTYTSQVEIDDEDCILRPTPLSARSFKRHAQLR